MAATAFDTLDAARKLKAAGIEAEHAEAIVGVMGQSVNQLVTVKHFDAEIAKLRTENMRTHLISVGVMITAIALATTIISVMLTQGSGV